MSDFDESLERHIEIMNVAFLESEKPEDEYTKDFKKMFKKSTKHVERLVRIKEQAEGRSDNGTD